MTNEKQTESNNSRMVWKKLLSFKRVSALQSEPVPAESGAMGNSNTIGNGSPNSSTNDADNRSAFEKDYDQIIYSYPFRRLQDKTQVIPFPEYDFVHTRLTHSLEVASIGRSLGKFAAKMINQELESVKPEDHQKNDPLEKSAVKIIEGKFKVEENDIATLVMVACLAHDIGNPPFGHSGEDAISSFFKNQIKDSKIEFFSQKNENREADLVNFEGNANGFRIITQHNKSGKYENSFVSNPTCALLGTFTKYPCESSVSSRVDKQSADKRKSLSKYGFFQDQKELFEKIAKELGLPRREEKKEGHAYWRHPLAFLMEAADDIAYAIIDLEDACRLKLIDFGKKYKFDKGSYSPEDILIKIAKVDEEEYKDDFDGADDKQKISYLRARAIGALIGEISKEFKDEYDKIMIGEFDKALIDDIDSKDNLDLIKKMITEHVYNERLVLENEISGYEVVEHLIESFAKSCGLYSENEENKKNEKYIKIRKLLPPECRQFEITSLSSDEDKYKQILRILDYVSGMTDKYAMNLYRKIKGIGV
jgi:dGTPase